MVAAPVLLLPDGFALEAVQIRHTPDTHTKTPSENESGRRSRAGVIDQANQRQLPNDVWHVSLSGLDRSARIESRQPNLSFSTSECSLDLQSLLVTRRGGESIRQVFVDVYPRQRVQA